MHGLNNNTNQVQKMPMFMKALKIYYTVCSQKTCTSVFNYQSLRQTYRRGKPGAKNPLKGSSKGSL